MTKLQKALTWLLLNLLLLAGVVISNILYYSILIDYINKL